MDASLLFGSTLPSESLVSGVAPLEKGHLAGWRKDRGVPCRGNAPKIGSVGSSPTPAAKFIAKWCNGSTTDFDSVCTSSNLVLVSNPALAGR